MRAPDATLHRYVMHAIDWEAGNLMASANLAELRGHGAVDFERALTRLQAFIKDQRLRDKNFAKGWTEQPLQAAELKEVLQAHATVHGAGKSLEKALPRQGVTPIGGITPGGYKKIAEDVYVPADQQQGQPVVQAAPPVQPAPVAVPPSTGDLANPKKGDQITVGVHPAIHGRQGVEQTAFHVTQEDGDKVKISRHADSEFGTTLPKSSLKHFINDLAGKVDLPPSGKPEIDAVTGGMAQFLGKGDDGLAFRVGDKVVKVSTTVPYQPENSGHLTPDEAKHRLKSQVEVGNKLADLGVTGVQRSEFVEHGDKGFQIKPWVEIPKKFTREQLDKIQDTLIGIHKAGYALHDDVQAGLDDKGEPVMFDVGKAALRDKKRDKEPVYNDILSDMDAMRRFYAQHGEEFVRRDVNEGEQAWMRAENRVHALRDGKLKPDSANFVEHLVQQAAEKRRQIARATLQGKELDGELGVIDFHVMDLMFDVNQVRKKQAEGPKVPPEK